MKNYLSDEAVDVSMSEIVWQDDRLKQFSILNYELFSSRKPLNNVGILLILNKMIFLR